MSPRLLLAFALFGACHSSHDHDDMGAQSLDGGPDFGAFDAAMPDLTPAPDLSVVKPPFDWVGIIGTGQSLSVGATAVYMTNAQPFHNLMLTDKGPSPTYPITATSTAQWAAIPLIETTRANLQGSGAGYGDGQYPENLDGETPHSGMANTLTKLWNDRGGSGEYVSVHSVVGWSGNCLSNIDKEGTGRAYPASLNEASVWKSMAASQNKTYGILGIILTHGECDAGNAMYGQQLYDLLWTDYDNDIKALTGQTQDPVLFVSQQSTVNGGETGSAVQVWQAGVAHPGKIVCTGPKYQYGYNPGLLHLPAPGYEEMGEKYAEVFDLIVNQHQAWTPLQPNKVTRSGATVTVDYDVPNPPLVFDAHIPLPHQTANTQWKNGKGFEAKSGNTNLTINSVAIDGSSVVITLSADPGANAKVTIDYALTQDGTGNNGGTANGFIGALRDSDPFVGWDEETIAVDVTQNSTNITTSTANGFAHRATKDILSGNGVPDGMVVTTVNSGTQLTLSTPWTGASGTVMLTFHHDEFNYAVHSTMVEQ